MANQELAGGKERSKTGKREDVTGMRRFGLSLAGSLDRAVFSAVRFAGLPAFLPVSPFRSVPAVGA
jgi:hypothetical protein